MGKYTDLEIQNAINRIESCMKKGWIELCVVPDGAEMYVIRESIKLFKEKFEKECN